MKNNVILNYILVGFAWNLYLNDAVLFSAVMLCISIGLMLYKIRKYNVLRIACVFVASLICLIGLYSLTTLNLYYRMFEEFAVLVSLNISLSNEMIKKTSDSLSLVHSVFSLVMLMFFMVSVILPDEWYTIFTKTNIYALITFIFIPYEACLTLSIFTKEYRLNKTVLN